MLATANLPKTRFSGIPVSPGFARGPLVVGAGVFEAPEHLTVAPEMVKAEWERLKVGIRATKQQILLLQQKMAEVAGEDSAAIFDAHVLMLEDAELLKKCRRRIEQKFEAAEYAYYHAMQAFAMPLRQIEDEYLRERTLDMEDVAQRVVRNLLGCPEQQAAAYHEPHILLVHELTPSSAAGMDRSRVLALITEIGSQTSHGAILARSMGIPAVVGVHDLANRFPIGTDCLVDGSHGDIFLNPDEALLVHYAAAQVKQDALQAKLCEVRDQPATTLDGQKICLGANIEFLDEIDQIAKAGAEGVGLYRTEFFYLNRKTLPTEEEQYQNYKTIAQAAAPHSVIVRTLDIGGDKLHELHRTVEENNPFLGWRGIRVCLTEPEIFKTQLRAILRASAHGKLSIMFPMISGYSELRAAKAMLNECKSELCQAGIAFDEKLQVGCMIEIPSAAIIARQLAREVDFFSVGTNDLIQYTIAVDRGNERVADLYQPCHPAIIQLLKIVSEAARQAGIWCGVCGQMAADITLTPLLVALGFDELSASCIEVPKVKFAIRRLQAAGCRNLLTQVLKMTEPEEIHEFVREVALEHYPELFG
jgi:phosphoenolpyruvate-protein phosphotransferase (PTS system enzyme I)